MIERTMDTDSDRSTRGTCQGSGDRTGRTPGVPIDPGTNDAPVKVIMYTTFAAIFAAIFVCAPAYAHMWERKDGTAVNANWIMQSAAAWCCGPKDCEPVGGRVYWTPKGWFVRGWRGSLMTGSAGLHLGRTPDGRPWACRNVEKNELRCLFLNEPHG